MTLFEKTIPEMSYDIQYPKQHAKEMFKYGDYSYMTNDISEDAGETNPDEFVLEDVKMVHYEVMNPKEHSWIGIYLNNGKIYHLNISGDNLSVLYSEETP